MFLVDCLLDRVLLISCLTRELIVSRCLGLCNYVLVVLLFCLLDFMLCNLCHSSVNGSRHSTKFLFINYVTIITSRALLNQRENFLSVTNIQHFILPPNNIHHTITKLTMSLLRTLPTRALPLLRIRPFSTSPYVSRSVVEGTKDVIDAVNRSVGKGLKKGIETGGESIRLQLGKNLSISSRLESLVLNMCRGRSRSSKVYGWHKHI